MSLPCFAHDASAWQQGGLRPGEIVDLRYTPDNKHLVYICTAAINQSPSGYIVLTYNIANRYLDTLLIIQSYNRPLLSPDTKFLICDNSKKDTITVWSLLQRQSIAHIAFRGTIQAIESRACTDDNTIVAVITDNGQTNVKCFNALNGALTSSFPIVPTYNGIAAYAQVTDNGKAVKLLTRDLARKTEYIEVWDVQTREHSIEQKPEGISISVFDGRYRAYSSWFEKTTTIYDISTHDTVIAINKILTNMILLPGGYLAGFTIEQNADSLSYTYHMYLLNLQTRTYRTVPFSDYTPAIPNLKPMLSFSHDYTSFTATWNTPESCDDINPSSKYSGFALYKVQDGSLLETWPTAGHIGQVRTLVISPNGKYGASTSDDFQTLLWDIETGIATGRLAGKGALTFSPGSATLVRANTVTSTLEKISIQPFAVVQSTLLLTVDVKTLCFSPNGQYLLCAAPTGIAVYSWPALRLEYSILSSPDLIADANFTADNNNIMAVTFNKNRPGEYRVQVRNTFNGELLSQKTLSSSREGKTVQLSHDASLLIVSSPSEITVSRIADGERIRTIHPQAFTVSIPVLTNDGKYIVLAKRDLTNRNDHISYYHLFTAFSLNDPTEDFIFDRTITDKGHPGLATITPSGTGILYACQTSCNMGRIYYADLTRSTHPLIISDTQSLHIAPGYTGVTYTNSIRLATPTPVPGIVTGIAISDSSLVRAVSLLYSRSFPDTVRTYNYNNSYAPAIILIINSVYATKLSFSILIYSTSHNGRDTLCIPVTATILGPQIQLGLEEVDFDTVPLRSSTTRYFHVGNDNGNAFLYISSIALYDPTNQVNLHVERPLPKIFSPREDMLLTVSYSPWKEDSLNAYIVIISNDTTHPEIRIPVRGKSTSAVSVSETESDNTIQFAPNPVTSVLTISVPETGHDYTVELISTEGHYVLNRRVVAGEQILTLDTQAIPAGMYYCRITTLSGTITKPVLILR